MAPTDEAQEFAVTRLEAVSSNVEEIMQYVGVEARLIQSRSRTRQCLHVSSLSTIQAVNRVIDHSEVHLTGRHGWPFLSVYIDQVEMYTLFLSTFPPNQY